MSEPPAHTGQPGISADSRLPSLGPRGEGWLLLQLLLLAAILGTGLFIGSNWAGAPRFATALAGVVLLLASATLVFYGLRDLDRSVSPLPRPGVDSVLVQDGIYRRLRHPIYAGLMLGGVGWSLLMASFVALVLAIALTVLLDLKARREEAWLRERYPAYAPYAAQTRRFVPGLY